MFLIGSGNSNGTQILCPHYASDFGDHYNIVQMQSVIICACTLKIYLLQMSFARQMYVLFILIFSIIFAMQFGIYLRNFLKFG